MIQCLFTSWCFFVLCFCYVMLCCTQKHTERERGGGAREQIRQVWSEVIKKTGAESAMPCMACSNHKCPSGPTLTGDDFAVWQRSRMVIVEISGRTVCVLRWMGTLSGETALSFSLFCLSFQRNWYGWCHAALQQTEKSDLAVLRSFWKGWLNDQLKLVAPRCYPSRHIRTK